MKRKGLSESEARSLMEFLDATTEHHALIIQLLMVSGLRTHELFSLKVKDLDFVNSNLTLWKGAKNSMGRQISLPKWFVSRARGKVFRSGLIGDSQLVVALGYGSKNGTVQSFKASLRASWQVIKRKVWGNTLNLGLHCLRHTYTVNVFEATGRDIRKTQFVMGHKSISSTEKYLPYVDESEILEITRRMYENKN